jgi:mannose-6-phosphate isomerase-like protein (cupin superfamily)
VRLAYDAFATSFFRHQTSFVSELPVVIAVRREMTRIGDEKDNNPVKGRSRPGGTLKLLLALTTSVTMAVLLTAAGVPTTVTYVPHDKVSATMAKGGSIINDQGLIVLAQRRGAGEVEVHEKTNHVFIIVEGEATMVTGGILVGARQTGPDQRRASSIQGGQTHHLTKGDVITIPARTPHWWKEVPTQTIAYYAVNMEN